MPNDSEDMYNDGPAPAAAPAGDKPEEKEGDEGGQTFIVPRSAFGGKELKPGDTCDIRVKAVHENDVECEPCEGHDEEPAKEPEAPMPEEGGMSSMME